MTIDPGGLPEAPESPDEETEKLDEIVNDVAEVEESYAHENVALAEQLSKSLANVSAAETNLPTIDLATDSLPTLSNEAISDQSVSDRLTALEKQAARAVAETKKAPEEDKKWTASQYVGLFFGVTISLAAVGLLIEYLVRKSHGQPTDDLPPLPPDTSGIIESLVDQWKSYDDTKFWTTLAGYVDKNATALTGPQQIVFMNLTIQICPLTGFWLWQTAQDKAGLADRCVAAYEARSSTGDMYRLASTLTYQGQPLPRAVTADVLRLALSWVFKSAPTIDAADSSVGTQLVAEGEQQ